MDVFALGAAILAMGAVLTLALAVLFGDFANAKVRGRLEGVLSGASSSVDTAGSVSALRRSRSVPTVYQSLVSGEWLARLSRDLRLADSQLMPVDFIALRVAFAGVGFVLPFLLLGGAFGLIAGAGAALVGFQLPQMWMERRRKTRAARLEEQLPEALSFVANSLKAGFGLLQSLNLAAQQLENPIAAELGQTVYETNVGSSAEEAFANLGQRNVSKDLDMVVTAILIQRSVGGNLAEILETVAYTMRDRVRIRGEINTLTAQQRMTGVIIGLLPVGVGGIFLMVSPEYISVLFTENVGRVMLGIAAVMETIGIVVIRRILDIEV